MSLAIAEEISGEYKARWQQVALNADEANFEKSVNTFCDSL